VAIEVAIIQPEDRLLGKLFGFVKLLGIGERQRVLMIFGVGHTAFRRWRSAAALFLGWSFGAIV
jgi:hypothetical protein